jgi:hypothetical protein
LEESEDGGVSKSSTVKMLNTNTGGLSIKGVTLGPTFTKNEFNNSVLVHDVLKEDNYGYTRYQLNPQSIWGERWAILLYFNQKQILEIISLSLQDDEKMQSWKNWSEEKELQKKTKHDLLLAQYLGSPPYQYHWGQISSQYESRSGSSHITIRYS